MPELLPGVHLVDGVGEGTHVYLVKDKGDSWVLIDSGLPGSETPTAAYLKSIGVAPTSVRKILVTHLHKDHTGALRKTIALTKARTYAHWLESDFIAMKPEYDGPGMPPVEPVTIDEKVKDGDELDIAGGVVVYHTPGHTPGHVAYYLPSRKILFSGDLFFGADHGIMLTTKEYTHHTLSAQISARRIAPLAVDSLMSYHGGPFLKDGGAKVRALVAGF